MPATTGANVQSGKIASICAVSRSRQASAASTPERGPRARYGAPPARTVDPRASGDAVWSKSADRNGNLDAIEIPRAVGGPGPVHAPHSDAPARGRARLVPDVRNPHRRQLS